MTKIRDEALDLIWDKELVNKEFSQDVYSYWTKEKRANNNLVKNMMDADSKSVLPDRARQLGQLQIFTGSASYFESRASKVSKDTYVLLNVIHGFRNRDEHPEDEKIHVGVAVSAIMACIELLACLARELN